MFTIAKVATYSWPIEVQTPTDGGQFEKSTFDVVFKRISTSKLKTLIGDEKTDSDFAREVVFGWKGVRDEAGNEIPFSESALESLLEIPSIPGTIVVAYLQSVQGAKRKN